MRIALLPRLADWPFAVKMGLAPALALAGVIFLGLLGSAGNIAQSRLMQRVVALDLPAATAMLQAAAALREVDARQPGQTMAEDKTNVAAARRRLLDSLDDSRARLNAIQAGGPGTAPPLAAVQADLARLSGALAANQAAPAMPAGMPIEAAARALQSDVVQAADFLRQDAASASREAARQSAPLTAIFGATALLILALVTACAIMITRRTVLAIRGIANATLLVAKGGTAPDIQKLARGDELGAIVESLRAFQTKNQRIAFLAEHDGLTALPNRALFQARLASAIAQCGEGLRCAVHCLDLDHFKAINDTLGHDAGDALLQCVAARLVRCTRETDTVARLGGDEFGIIQYDVDGAQDAGTFAQRVIDTVSQPYDIAGQPVSISTSIGTALTPCAEVSPDTLPGHAELALCRAKAEGRGTWRIYEPHMDAALHQRRLLELDLRAALGGQQFELHYQPLIDVQSREVNGLEALIRWHHPERGLIPPNEFIPLAEETGLIVPIGGWVLRQACQDAVDWPAALKVSVNLSPLQFRDSNLLPLVQHALAASGLPGWRLEVEITDSVLLSDSEMVLATLNKLRAMGICIAMDDFGTGHASVSFLRNFRFDKIKIDRSFIRDLADGSRASAIVHAVTGLGSSLGIKTTAAGVETEDQLARLREEGCTEVQGYLFSPPCPARDVARVVAELSRGKASTLVALEEGLLF
jgi:diguanylate cyclase (GGDEF)-like protein